METQLKVLFIADMEGIMGIADERLTGSGSFEWKYYGRKLYTEEINAAALGALQAGANEIILCDTHDIGRNTLTSQLMPWVKLSPPHIADSTIQGFQAMKRFYDDNQFDAATLLGYHPKSGSAGFFPHTIDTERNKEVKINEKPLGEIGLIAGICGVFNVPVVCITGDKHAVEEAKEIIPNIASAETKEQLHDGRVALKPISQAKTEIINAVKKGLLRRKSIKPLKFKEPTFFEYKLKKIEDAIRIDKPKNVKLTEARFTWVSENYLDGIRILWDLYLQLITRV